MLMKGKIFQDEPSILNIYAPNAMASTFIKDFRKAQITHCTAHHNSGRLQQPTLIYRKIREIETKQRHIEDKRIYETNGFNRYLQNFYPKTKAYNFFSAPHGTFSTIDHIISHKTGLNKNIESIPYTLSHHHGRRLIFNNNINNRKPTFT